MSHSGEILSLVNLLIGVLIVCAVLLKMWLRATGIPALVSFLLLGVVLRVLHDRFALISDEGAAVFGFLAGMGVIAILFRVGLESNLYALIHSFLASVPVWLGNVVLSGVPAYFLARDLLGVDIIPSLFVAVALTATSVAVSLEVWREGGVLQTKDGQLLTEVAGLDDISGIALMGMLLAVIPVLREGHDQALAGELASAGGVFIVKAALFGAACLLFARYGERYIMDTLRRFAMSGRMLLVMGTGMIIAALAGQLGFSLAIGALFAGLIFSRDPEAVQLEISFEPIYEFFSPFFFIGVGLSIDIATFGDHTVLLTLVLLIIAVLGKVIGTALPALLTTSFAGAAAIGVSMVPRAEIAMVVMQEGRKLGDWAVPGDLFTAMALISLVTCLFAPLIVRAMLTRWPPQAGADR